MPATLKPSAKDRTVVHEWFDVQCVAAFEDRLSPSKRTKGRLAQLTYTVEMADTMGINRRIYPTALMAPEVERLNTIAEAGRLYGRVDHPKVTDYRPVMEQLAPTLADAGTLIRSVTLAGKKLTVVQDILDNPHGQQLASILRAGGDPGLSQRAVAVWEAVTDDEAVRYGVPTGESASIARFLRLVTYDNVADPGFPDAHVQSATEAASEETTMKTLEELKALHPELYRQALAAGASVARDEMTLDQGRKITEAVEAAKPVAVAAAVAPIQTALDAARNDLKPRTEALEGVIALLGEKGLLKPADAQAAAAINTLKSEKAALEAKVAELTTAKAALETSLAAMKTKVGQAEAIAAVEAKYGPTTEHKLLWPMIKLACEGLDAPDKALERAAARLADIIAIRGTPANESANRGGGGNGNAAGNGEGGNKGAATGLDRAATARFLGLSIGLPTG